VNAQTPFSDSQYGTLQVVLNTGIPSTGIISVVGAAEASGGGISMQPEAEPSISETNIDILRAECIALFNRYLESYRQLEAMKTLHNLFTVRDFWRDLTGEDSNGVMKCAVACIYNQFSPEGSRRKPLESCSDYVKRVGEESWVKKLHEILEKTRTKPLPDSSTPIFDPDNPNTWPVFDLEEVLKALRKAFKDGGLVLGDLQLSSDCYEKFSRAIEMFAEVLIIFNNAMRLIVQLMQIAIKLRRSPCWDLLNLEQEFRDRNLFDFSWGYFEYFSEWIRNWWNPFAPTPRLNPVLANIPSNTTIDELNELAIALGQEYKSISNGPNGETASISLGEKIAQIEKDVYKLKNKGLFVDTLIMGTVSDMKKLGSATSKAFSRSRKNVQKRVEGDAETIKTEELKTMGNETLEEFKTQASVTLPEFTVEDGGVTKKITTHTTQQTVESKSIIEDSSTVKPEEYELLEEIH
jgi:hypothetical protein